MIGSGIGGEGKYYAYNKYTYNIVIIRKFIDVNRDAGTLPVNPISVELNDYLTFKMKDTREDMTLTFKDESTIHTFDIGLKLKRTDTYLDNCTRLPGGHLLPKLEYKTLKNRQAEFNNKMSALRNKVQ